MTTTTKPRPARGGRVVTASTQDALPVYVPGADQLDPGARGVLFTTAGERLETEQGDILAELAGDAR